MDKETKELQAGAVEEIRRGIYEREQAICQMASYQDYRSFCLKEGRTPLGEQEFKTKMSAFFKDSYRLAEAVEQCESTEFVTLLVGISLGCIKDGPEFLNKMTKLISLLALGKF
jgi:hypothetical protein